MTIKERKILVLLAARQAVSEHILQGTTRFTIKENGLSHSVEYLVVYDYLTELIQMEEDVE